MAKFKIGDKAYAWDHFVEAEFVQIAGTVVRVYPVGALSETQEEVMVIIEEKTKVGPLFHIFVESSVHKEPGVTYATDPDNQKRFDKTFATVMKNSIARKTPRL